MSTQQFAKLGRDPAYFYLIVNGTKELKVLVHPAEEGGYWTEVPALPGCVSEGETFDEVLANIRQAAEGWIEVEAELTLTNAESQSSRLGLDQD